ncbi:MAG: sulfotransferase domain-containing protein [Bacteroidales bacterium]|nr:sulfotransferase domain-containing protein [Bacteroidales bacterium]
MKNLVWIVSYPKSGNTWFRLFLSNYKKNAIKPIQLRTIESASIASSGTDFEFQIGLDPSEMTGEEVDLYRPEMYCALSEKAKQKGEICYKKAHDAYIINNDGEPIFPEKISKYAVYFVRNPMDVCVSFSNHNAEELDKTIHFLLDEKSFLPGQKAGQLRQKLLSWKSHVQSWKNQTLIPVHFVRYEDMIRKPMETFGSIITFLELEYDEKRLERAIINSDFKLLQQMEEENGFKEKTQLCQHFFWKGKIGNYRDYLSKDQIDRIVEYNYDTMKEFGYIDESGALTV